MISRDFITMRGQCSMFDDPAARIFVETRQAVHLQKRRSVLWRALRLGRGRASGELLQAVAFAARRGPNYGVVLRHFYGAGGHLERLRIFSLLIERQRQAENVHGSRVAGVSVDGLLQILLRGRVILFLELNGTENRISVRAQIRLVNVDLLLRRARRDADVGVRRLQRLKRHRARFAETLIFVDIRVARSLADYPGDRYQSLGMVPVKAQHFAAHGFGLLRVVGILVEAHRVLIEQHANLTVGEFAGKVVGRLLRRGGISSICRRRLPGIKLRLCLGLRWTLCRWQRRALRGYRLTRCRWVMRRRFSAVPGLGPNRDAQYS